MKGILVLLIILLVLFLVVALLVFILANKFGNFLYQFFGTKDIKEAIEKSEIENENTPKSLASMESTYLRSIKEDFPDLNTNEIKSMAENGILDYFNAIENKDLEIVKNYNETIKNLIQVKINDINKKNIKYSNIKFHKTVINRYEKSDSIATLITESSLEYYYKENDKINKKTQDRFRVELIYVIDATKLDKEQKLLGLNCPNCGAPITTLKEKKCKYCDALVKDIVKRSWVINNIKSF